jgi:integrase/recombinase XerD
MMLLGKDGRRWMTIHKLPNNELFKQYDAEIVLRLRNPRNLKDTRRLLNLFKTYIGEFPPTAQLAKSFLAQYANRKPRTLYRYFMMLKPFMKWYGESIDDVHIKVPRTLAPNTPEKDIDALIHAIETKRSAKETIERDVLLVLVSRYAGLRREELSNLKVRDITETQIFVREGKGAKDRCISLSENINGRLHYFIKDKKPDDSVFNQKPASISMKILIFAKKAGVTHLHTHTLRHRFATSLKDAGVDMYTIMTLMGHANLNTTQTYLAMSEDAMGEAIEKLDKDTSRRRTKISKPHETSGTQQESIDISKSHLTGTSEGLSNAFAKLDGNTQFAQGTSSAGEVSRTLEQINESLSDIKKKLGTEPEQVAASKVQFEKDAVDVEPALQKTHICADNPISNTQVLMKDAKTFKTSDKILDERHLTLFLLRFQNHHEYEMNEHARLLKFFGYFSLEKRRPFSPQVKQPLEKLMQELEKLIYFLKLEFEERRGSKKTKDILMDFAPTEVKLAHDEQGKADIITEKQTQLLKLIDGARDSYKEYRARIRTYLQI